jgi:uncharacterized protein YyaL (SSP411 family)
LLTYAALTVQSRHRTAAESALGGLASLVVTHPRFAGWAAAVSEAAVAGPLEIAVVDRPDLAALAIRTRSPGAVVVTAGDSPLLADRPPGAGYVCRGFVCDRPETDPQRFAAAIRASGGSVVM